MNIRYFDRHGNPISPQRWSVLRNGPDYYRVASEYVGDFWVSTVWIGLDVGLSFMTGGSPQIFETKVFEYGDMGSDVDEYTRTYDTLEAARSGHVETVTLLRLDVDLPTS